MVNKRNYSFNENRDLDKKTINNFNYILKKENKKDEILSKEEIKTLLQAITDGSENSKPITIYPKGFKQSYLGYYQPQLINSSINYRVVFVYSNCYLIFSFRIYFININNKHYI